MLNEDEELDFVIAQKVISYWITTEYDKEFNSKRKNKRVRRIFKKNLWKSSWGELITHNDIRNPSSYQGRIFKRRFRVPFGLFMDELVPKCRDGNIFNTSEDNKVRVPLEFKILICLRILGRGRIYLLNYILIHWF